MNPPEKETLRSALALSSENSPSPISPCPTGHLSPAHLVFTPGRPEKLNCLNCDAEMSINHQCEANDSDSSWEDIENEEDLYPKLDVESDDWAEKFTNSIRDYHGLDESK